MDIDQLRSFCLSLPAVTEDVKWDNDLVFSIGDKMFCVASLEPPFKCSFKVPDGEFEELSVRQGFQPAPYMARAKWVLVTQPTILHKKEWEEYIKQSYELVKAKLTKKLRASLGID
jgi:predicted DNA-binding protein (MmcQ/YjbR family)